HSSHVNRSLCQANHRLTQLQRMFEKPFFINVNVYLIICNSLIRSVITYSSTALQTFQNKVFRIITKLPRVKATKILHEQTGKMIIRSHVSRPLCSI
ncbi:hypothetical protein B7P43_G03489, partial [Cryptotermes secundus]